MKNKNQLKKDQVYSDLRELITSGVYAVDSKLPCETELASLLKVSRITLRASLDRLGIDGLVRRVRGSGTFVTSPENRVNTGTIMVVHFTPSGTGECWSHIVFGVSKFCQINKVKTFSITHEALTLYSQASIRSYIEQGNVMGIIAVASCFNGSEPLLYKLKCANVPVVLANAAAGDTGVTGFASIVIDEKKGWEMAVAQLAKNGYSRVAMIGLDGGCGVGFRRHNTQESMELLSKYGIDPIESLIRAVKWDRDDVLKVVTEWMAGPARPNAILCYSDVFAVYVYEALECLHLSIPGDVAVMGTCGFPDAQLLMPSLSTIDYGYERIAEMAVEMLLDKDSWFDAKTGHGRSRKKAPKLKTGKSTR